MLAAIALAFVGCSKEIDIQKPEDNTTGTHTLTFKVEKAADTRTSVVEGDGVASYLWTEGDDAYFHIYENGKAATEIQMSLSSDNKIATFTATFNDTDTTAYSYTAVYGSDVSNKKNPLIPDTQEPVLNSFDPAADVLVSAEPITLSGNVAADANTEFLFKLQRVVSVNKMTLKGLESGEVIKTVELISTDKYFSARYGFEDGKYTGSKKSLTFDYTLSSDAIVGTDGTFPVYFTSAPVTDASFSVRVTTDKNVYLRDDFTSKLTLAVGTFRRFGINLSGYGEAITEGTNYVKVHNIDDLYSGATYILVGGSTYALGAQKDNNRNAVAVTDNDGVININNEIEAYPIEIEENSSNVYTLKDIRNNKYLYTDATGSNRLFTREDIGDDDYALWTISISNGVVSISNVGNTSRGILGFNPNIGTPLFAAYGTVPNGGTSALALYVDESTCVELEDPELEFDETEVTVAWENIGSFEAPVLSNPHSVAVTYSSSDENVATVSSTGEITFVGNGTTTVTASSAKGNGYAAGTAQHTLTVTGAPAAKGTKDNPFTVAEVRDYMDEGGNGPAYVTGIVSSIYSQFSSKYGNGTFYISDDGEESSDQFEAYRVLFLENKSWVAGNSEISVGDEVLIYAGSLTIYQETTYETVQDSGSYLYSLKGATSEIVPTISTTDISGISAEGINNATTTISVTNADGWDASVTSDGTIVTAAAISGTTITYTVAANSGNLRTGSITITLSKIGRSNVSAIINVVQDANPNVGVKEYTLTIDVSKFNTTSYAANNNSKQSNAVSSDESTFEVSWISNQVMKGNGDHSTEMQWQKNNGYIYNTTDLGTIKSVTVNSTAGSFTTYYGSSSQPSSGTTVGGGFFQVKVGGATGYTSSIIVVFER